MYIELWLLKLLVIMTIGLSHYVYTRGMYPDECKEAASMKSGAIGAISGMFIVMYFAS